MTVDINDLTLKQIREIQALTPTLQESPSFQPFKIGQAYLIRTVTHIDVGIVRAVGEQELVLSDAAWVADTGRFHDALKGGIEKLPAAEIEPYVDDVILGRGSIIDATQWNHPLPREQK